MNIFESTKRAEEINRINNNDVLLSDLLSLLLLDSDANFVLQLYPGLLPDPAYCLLAQGLKLFCQTHFLILSKDIFRI